MEFPDFTPAMERRSDSRNWRSGNSRARLMMKRCPKCGQTYADQNLNFCLNDGELLMLESASPRGPKFADDPLPTSYADDSPPTIMMDSPRATNPTGFPTPERWQ